jgi:hypothetical protein
MVASIQVHLNNIHMSSYRRVNILRLSYSDQAVNAVYFSNLCVVKII